MRLPVLGLLAAVGMTSLAAHAADVEVVAGPMVGHVTDKGARVWMQLSISGEVKLTVFDSQHNVPVSAVKLDVEGPSPFVCDVPLSGLQPDHAYRVEAEFEGQPLSLPGPNLIVRTAPVPGDQATFTIGFGSNLYLAPPGKGVDATQPPVAGSAPIFKAINDLNPRAFFFLGNNGYLPARVEDFPTTRREAYRTMIDMETRIRRMPDLQSLFRTTPCYAVYDMRDYGPLTGAGGRGVYPFASEAQVAFQRFWPNPDWGTPDNPGCFCNFSYGDADFFLLDTRTYRAAESAATTPATKTATESATQPESASLLGKEQVGWLKKNLKASRATFKVIASAQTLFTNPGPEEKELLSWLAENQVDGLVMIAGNQRAGGLMPVAKAGAEANGPALKYPLFTLMCSNLTDIPAALLPGKVPEGDHVGDVVEGKTFGTLDFGGPRDRRFMTLRLRDETGKARVEQTLFADQLKN